MRFHLIQPNVLQRYCWHWSFFIALRRIRARVALFPGTWNPPTIAHVDIARMARIQADEVVWLLPRVFPHKSFEGAGFDARRAMLETLARQHAGFSAAVSAGGLYAEMADEARDYFGPETEISLVLGRDAAERIAAWDYGAPGVFDDFVRRHRLLVAARSRRVRTRRASRGTDFGVADGVFVGSRIVFRSTAADASGEDWRDLVPPAIAEMVRDAFPSPGPRRGRT